METQTSNINEYWHIALRWWWILALAILGASLGAYVYSDAKTPMYKASVKVLVQGGQTPGAPSLSEIQASQQLARNYGDLIKTRPILDKVIQELSLTLGSSGLSSMITITNPRSLIEVQVINPDPQLAATIANTTVRIFIDDFLNRQFAQIAQFQASLSQFGIGDDPSIIAAQASTLSTLSVVEEAVRPTASFSPQPRRDALLASILGLLTGALVIFLIEFLDNSIKSLDELQALVDMPNLGLVLERPSSEGHRPIMSYDKGKSDRIEEAYHFIRTNLDFAALETEGLGSLLITSSVPSEGKTTTAANLAISMAKEGRSVILVDADLRRPTMHKVFGIENQNGLTQLLLGNSTLDEVDFLPSLPNLKVVTSGPLPPDAPSILRSSAMANLVEEFKSNADILILDSPPLLSVTDPMLLAPMVDGVILVLDSRRTGRETVRRGANILRQISPKMVGTVLNKVHSDDRKYNYHYYYYPSHYSENNTEQPDRKRSWVLSRVVRKWKRDQRTRDNKGG